MQFLSLQRLTFVIFIIGNNLVNANVSHAGCECLNKLGTTRFTCNGVNLNATSSGK